MELKLTRPYISNIGNQLVTQDSQFNISTCHRRDENYRKIWNHPTMNGRLATMLQFIEDTCSDLQWSAMLQEAHSCRENGPFYRIACMSGPILTTKYDMRLSIKIYLFPV